MKVMINVLFCDLTECVIWSNHFRLKRSVVMSYPDQSNMCSWLAVNHVASSLRRVNPRNFDADRHTIGTAAARQLCHGGNKSASFYEVLSQGGNTENEHLSVPTLGRVYMDFDVGQFRTTPSPETKRYFFEMCERNAKTVLYSEKEANPQMGDFEIRWLESSGVVMNKSGEAFYKVSYHAKVDGFKTDLSSMKNLVLNYQHLLQGTPSFHPDIKVYGGTQKFRAPLCSKGSRGRDTVIDTRLLMPLGDPEFGSVQMGMDINTMLQWVRSHYHKYTVQGYAEQLPFMAFGRRTVDVPLSLNNAQDVSGNEGGNSPSAVVQDSTGRVSEVDRLPENLNPSWEKICGMLRAAGFVNPVKKNAFWAVGTNNLYMGFKSDNEQACPVCHGVHDSENCYSVVISATRGVRVMRHSQHCSVMNLIGSRFLGVFFREFVDGDSFNHMHVARMLSERLPPYVYYVEDKRFYFWEGAYWRPISEIQAVGLVIQELEKEMKSPVSLLKLWFSVYEELGAMDEQQTKRLEFLKDKVCKFSALIGSVGYAPAIVRMLAHLRQKCDDDMVPFTEEYGTPFFDRRKELLHFTNGVVDLSDEVFSIDEPFALRPSHPWHFNSKTVGFPYSELYNPEKMAYLEHVMALLLPDEGARRMLQMYAGSCLDGFNDIKKFCVLTDRDDKEALMGNNGKTLFLSFLRHVLGDYGDVANKNIFVSEQKTDSSAAAPSVVKLKGKRMVTVDEPKATTFVAQEQLKTYTDGQNAHIAARGLYRDESIMSWQAKIFFACNAMQFPNFDTMDEAFTNRMMVIGFENVFTLDEVALQREDDRVTRREPFSMRRVYRADPRLAEKLFGEYKLEFVHWLMRGYKMRKLDPGAFAPNRMPVKVKEFTDQLILRKSLIYEFLTTRLRPDPNLEPPAASEREILRCSVNLASITQQWLEYVGRRATKVTSLSYVKKMVVRYLSMMGARNALVDRTTNTHDLSKPPEILIVRGFRLLTAEDLASGEDFREKRRRIDDTAAGESNRSGAFAFS